jgi:hypothetical protein
VAKFSAIRGVMAAPAGWRDILDESDRAKPFVVLVVGVRIIPLFNLYHG